MSSAERVADADGRQYHIGVAPGEVAPWILLCGDPARADRIAQRFAPLRISRRHREYVTHTGSLGGREVTVMATGMGCDNTEIAVVEILPCVRRPTFIRVGTSGGLRPEIDVGSLVVSTGAVRIESTSLGFVEPGYPAVAHHEVVLALVSAAAELGTVFHVGLTATAAGFYGWQGRRGSHFEPRDPELVERLGRQNVLNLEMEASTLFTLATLGGVRAGAVCAVFANRPADRFIEAADRIPAEDRAVAVALRAIDHLAAMDARSGGGPFVLDPLRP